MIQAFIENPVLLLFIVAAVGYWIGSIRVRGSNLGVAAVLFVGLGFGGLSPDLHIPDIIVALGLAIFVYTVGLTSGPSFFATFRQRGSRDFIFVFAMLTLSAGIAYGLHFLFDLEASATSGLYAGSTTNTPALAGLLDAISNTRGSVAQKEELRELAVIGYSLSYPMGVLGVMFAIFLMKKLLKIDFRKEEEELKEEYPVKKNITNATVEIQNPEIVDVDIRDLKRKFRWPVVFGRIQHEEEVTLSTWDTKFALGDKVAIVGDLEDLQKTAGQLGKICEDHLSYDRSDYDIKRIFVSNPKIVGERLVTLNIQEKFAAIITRIRRGDMDILANANTVIELGDQVRFVARRRDIPKISELFGDSYEALSKIDLLSFGLGMALGLLLGMITFQLPGGVDFKLGYAGGPLIVALTLGALRRTGPIVWTLPYSANLTLRQIGLILMLASIGVNSGHTFVGTVAQGEGGIIFLAGTIISCSTAIATLFIGYKLLKIPFSLLMGMVSGQPAILDYALEQSKNQLPIIGFTLMLPVALITKIIYVQFLFVLLR